MNNYKKHIVFIITLLVLSISPAIAENNKSEKTQLLSEITQALGELSESIIKLTDGVKYAVEKSNDIVIYAVAKRTKNDLKDLSAIGTQFPVHQNQVMVETIDAYLFHPRPSSWSYLKSELSMVLSKGSKLLQEWNKERSDFIVKPSYTRLTASLNAGSNILERIKRMEAPTSKEELQALRKLNVRYKALLTEFNKALNAFNLYIEKMDSMETEQDYS